MSAKQAISDVFTMDNLPEELRALSDELQRRAMAAYNSLIEQGYKVPIAAHIVTERARNWGGLSDAPMPHHVIPHPGGWAVLKADSDRASVVTDTKREAIERGREFARNQKGRLVIHRQDGTVQNEHNYGDA